MQRGGSSELGDRAAGGTGAPTGKGMEVQEQCLPGPALGPHSRGQTKAVQHSQGGEDAPQETSRQRVSMWRQWAGGSKSESQEEVGAEPGPTMEERHIMGDSVMFGPEVVRLAAEEDEEQVSIMVAIEKAIEGVEEEGPHQGGLVGRFESEFVQPPVSPFQRMDEQGRAALKEVQAMLARGEELPPGPEWQQENPAQYRENPKFVRGTPHTKASAWARLVPKVDGLARVLDIIKNSWTTTWTCRWSSQARTSRMECAQERTQNRCQRC